MLGHVDGVGRRRPTRRWIRSPGAMPSRSAASADASTTAADRSTSIMATSRLVYGNATMRLSGPGPTSSTGDHALGNQAYGLAAATSVMGANSSPRAARCSSTPRPRWARRATSRSANVEHAWNSWWATSAGWNGASNANRFFSGSRWDQGGRSRRAVGSLTSPAAICFQRAVIWGT